MPDNDKDSKGQWFTNKELFLLIQNLQHQMEELNTEMRETRTLIRDYNGLRQKINDCETLLYESLGHKTGGKDVWGYITGAFGVLFGLAGFIYAVSR